MLHFDGGNMVINILNPYINSYVEHKSFPDSKKVQTMRLCRFTVYDRRDYVHLPMVSMSSALKGFVAVCFAPAGFKRLPVGFIFYKGHD
jgi:hypothetical protein